MAQIKDHIKSVFHSRPKFAYQPLNPDRKEIWVLVFDDSSQSQTSSTLRCGTKRISLRDDPNPLYYAVSYRWGKNPPLRRIILNDEEAWVPESAVKALRTVCHPVHGKRDLSVWIDAICINQSDDAEKSQLVAMMGDVYETASEVLIYLGDEESTTKAGFKAIDALLDVHATARRWQHNLPLGGSTGPIWCNS
jgi:hypothetical protein